MKVASNKHQQYVYIGRLHMPQQQAAEYTGIRQTAAPGYLTAGDGPVREVASDW
jgi:hypothetical protein